MSMHLTEGELTCRMACHGDFGDVMALNRNVFFGTDYLGSCYHDFIRDPKVYCFVGLLDGKVVAFNGSASDGPFQSVGIGARVHTDYLGTPVYQAFNSLTLEVFRESFPDQERRVWVSLDNDMYRNEAKLQSRGTTIIERWHSPHWRVPKSAIEKLLQDPPTISALSLEVLDLPQEQAIAALSDKRNQERLFPSGHIVGYYNWLPRLLTPSNIRQAVMSHRCRFSERENKLSVVSLSVPVLVPDGVLCVMHYNHHKPDLGTFMAHFYDHLAHVLKTVPQNGTVNVGTRCPMDVDMEEVEKILMPFLGDRRRDNSYKLGTGVFPGSPLSTASR